nr:variable surface lipoprotein [Mycoplasmopsis bovis]
MFRLFIALKGEDKFYEKSKFLLLGSVASLASIPFVAAKCGETKEEKN